MKTVEVEICVLSNHETFTLGRGRNYSAAVEDARRRARFAHSICAMVLTWKSPLIRAYSRPQHTVGAIVPREAIDPHGASWSVACAHAPGLAEAGMAATANT